VVVDPMVYNNYTADDCMYELGEYNNGKELRCKIYQVEKLSQVNSLTSTKLETTLIMDYEPFAKFPL